MEIEAEDVTDGIAKVVLRGRFDTTRAVEVELPFNRIVTEQRKVLVDLAAVSFLTSYAIRVLLPRSSKERQARDPVPRWQGCQGPEDCRCGRINSSLCR